MHTQRQHRHTLLLLPFSLPYKGVGQVSGRSLRSCFKSRNVCPRCELARLTPDSPGASGCKAPWPYKWLSIHQETGYRGLEWLWWWPCLPAASTKGPGGVVVRWSWRWSTMSRSLGCDGLGVETRGESGTPADGELHRWPYTCPVLENSIHLLEAPDFVFPLATSWPYAAILMTSHTHTHTGTQMHIPATRKCFNCL